MSVISHQEILLKHVRHIFPNENTLTNARKSTSLKLPGSAHYIELDLWLPNLHLAFEFQDAYHYITTWYSHETQASIHQYDKTKNSLVQEQGTYLITIPCWWDGNLGSLQETILFHRPDLSSIIKSDKEEILIPANPPFGFFPAREVPDVGELMAASFPLDSQFVNSFSPNSWWMGEKYDGIRCCWNPKTQQLYSRTGNSITIWPSVATHFPSSYLDSELWFGRGQFASSYSIVSGSLQASDWNTLRMITFDVPPVGIPNEPFELRYTSLLEFISKINPFVIVAPRVLVKHNKHLNEYVHKIIEEEGEGSVLRKVASHYEYGRTPLLIKLKTALVDHDAIVVKIGVDKSVHLKLPNGATFTVPSERVQVPLVNVGEIVTFTYETNSRRLVPAHPTITRVRSDVSWDDVVYNSAKEQKFLKDHLKTSGFTSQPQGHWNFKNMRLHMEKLAKNLGFDPLLASTWYTVTEKDVRQDKGGRTILQKLKGYIRAITRLFPELKLEKSAFPFPQLWWSSVGNRRKFFEGYAKANGFDPLVAEHWYTQPRDKIVATKGAYRVIFYHENSITKALIDLFPEVVWSKPHLRFPKYRFEDARRAVFEKYANENNFDPLVPQNWYSQTFDKIISTKGARRAILYHNASVAQALTDLFPEVDFIASKLPLDSSSWSSPERRRLFFEDYARANGLDPLSAEDWYSHPKDKILQEKNILDVIFYHNNNINMAIADLFPNIGFIKYKFKQARSMLGTEKQRREVMEKIAEHQGFNPLIADNWYNQNMEEIRSMKGVGGVVFYHQQSLPQALHDLFPEAGIDVSKFRTATWKDVKTRRYFFDQYAKEKGFNPKIPENWYSQPSRDILSFPNATSVLVHHNNNVIRALQDLYPDIGIDKTKFAIDSKWHNPENRLQFFTTFAKDNGFDPLNAENWYSISSSDLRAKTGARKVLFYYKNSITKALIELFPSIGLSKKKLRLNVN